MEKTVESFKTAKFGIRYYDGRFSVESYKTIKATLPATELKPFHRTVENNQEYKTLFFSIREIPFNVQEDVSKTNSDTQ